MRILKSPKLLRVENPYELGSFQTASLLNVSPTGELIYSIQDKKYTFHELDVRNRCCCVMSNLRNLQTMSPNKPIESTKYFELAKRKGLDEREAGDFIWRMADQGVLRFDEHWDIILNEN